MNDTLKVLSTHPEVGIISSFGTGFFAIFNVLNPILTAISLIIGISIGVMTLYAKIRGK
ncbi:MAG: hypothetical protein GOVbin4296_48 [Prokaryotic dsDNA virus sp.]|nr:MAG: hypothetical protein GOVbin4296_48 [Prokaryotic dsDNA virus sp.]|tara:strand:+ start:3431 stop:3607 length:177 start_codon:yes stop_codon:yes gene_type:complete